MGTHDVISSTDDAAFASNEKGAIVLWNEAANRLLGYSADEVLGRSCFKVISGFDVFGNPYCRSDCNLRRLARSNNAICPFQMQVRRSSGEYISAAFRIVPVSRQQLSDYQLVHQLTQIHATTDVAPKNYPNSGTAYIQVKGSPPNPGSTAHPLKSPLTNRECEVLTLLASGFSTNEISQRLHISVTTVRNHVQNMLRKLAVHSKLEAVSVAHRNHLI
ncbi:MAG: PAS domain-containing protein [Deltaproteobacteria bacterium]|nr:PAS domain-containing protein [Deltaproteobacteria bacterium]